MKKLMAILLSMLMLALNNHVSAQNKVEVIARLAPPNPDMSGIAVSSNNRVFLGFPRHADNHNMYALAELINGKPIPFPNKKYVYPSNQPFDQWLVSPHGMYMDKNDVLWVLDDGKRAGIKEIPEGAAKVVAIDINSNKILHTVIIKSPVLNNDSHYNDLRVDLTHGKLGTIYIANSGFGERYSLVVIDVATGKQKEVLVNHPSTSPTPKFMGFLEGVPHVYDFKNQSFPNGGADGIALSADSKQLYWTTITGRKLYSLSTDLLSNFSISETEIVEAITYMGEHPACDGLAEDDNGNIYFGAFEQQAIVQRNIAGKYTLLAYDKENFVWPDGLAYRNGYVYVTLGQWNRLPGFNNGKDLRKPPFLVVKIKTDN